MLLPSCSSVFCMRLTITHVYRTFIGLNKKCKCLYTPQVEKKTLFVQCVIMIIHEYFYEIFIPKTQILSLRKLI